MVVTFFVLQLLNSCLVTENKINHIQKTLRKTYIYYLYHSFFKPTLWEQKEKIKIKKRFLTGSKVN